jgi:hypothetical protein
VTRWREACKPETLIAPLLHFLTEIPYASASKVSNFKNEHPNIRFYIASAFLHAAKGVVPSEVHQM